MKAALWMAGSIASFVLMSIAGRETTAALHVVQVMEMRSVLGLLIILPFVFMGGGLSVVATRRPFQHIGRNVIHYAGQLAWLLGLTLIPLAELVSIEFTTPIWTAILAVIFLRERLTPARIGAIALGIAGILFIVRPGVGTADFGHAVVLFAAFTFGISLVMVKSLTRTDSTLTIIFWMMVIQSIIGLYPAYELWIDPPSQLWPWIVVIAFAGLSSHFCLTQALSFADATVVSPMDFSRVPLTALVGWLLYNERIDLFTAIGALLILSGNLLNLQKRPARPPTELP